MKEKTAAELFGTTPPGTPVKHRDVDPCANYKPRPRYRHRADGRPYPVDRRPEPVEKELPREYCPDGSPRAAPPRHRRRGDPD